MSQLEHQLPLSAVDEAPAVTPLAEQEISVEVLVEKYAKGKETSVHDVRRRVARALAAHEDDKQRAHWEERFLWAQETGFVPAGRINSAAGTKPFSCAHRKRACQCARSFSFSLAASAPATRLRTS